VVPRQLAFDAESEIVTIPGYYTMAHNSVNSLASASGRDKHEQPCDQTAGEKEPLKQLDPRYPAVQVIVRSW
jgi:hypothetical protein